MIKRTLLFAALASVAALGQGCFYSSHEIEVKPVEIKPMHITIDVNVKVEKQLDDFFGDLDKKAEKISSQEKADSTQISTQTATPAAATASDTPSTQTPRASSSAPAQSQVNNNSKN